MYPERRNLLHIFTTFILRAMIGVLSIIPVNYATAGQKRSVPNIVFILADDLGWADVGFHGSKNQTPNIDRLARTGVRLEQHYVYPTCSPTRCALLSGRYSSRFGVVSPTNARVFKEDTLTLPKALGALGYETAISGKWHLGSKAEWGPRQHGFDRSYGCLAGGIDQYLHLYKGGPYQRTWHRNDVFVNEFGHSTDLFTKEAAAFLEAKHDRPFFLYVAFTAVHLPIQETDDWLARYKDSEVEAERRRYAACVTHMDAAIGKLLATLEKTKQRANTVVIFTSDNGAPLRSTYGKPGGKPLSSAPAKQGQYPVPYESGPGGVNLPFRGQKGNVYEGGVRVPTVVNWPGRLEPAVVKAPVHVVDWMPTLLRLAGRKKKPESNWDGQDIWPLITGAEKKPAPRTFYWAQGALRRGDWKLVVRKQQVELFDLGKDREEKSNVADQHAKLVAELRAEFEKHQKQDAGKVLKLFP